MDTKKLYINYYAKHDTTKYKLVYLQIVIKLLLLKSFILYKFYTDLVNQTYFMKLTI